MKGSLKHISILLIISMTALIGSCGKTNVALRNANAPFIEFRDSLTGTYACIETYDSFYGPNTFSTVIGPATITVVKATDDSSLLMSSGVFTFVSADSNTITYKSPSNATSLTNYAHFSRHHDSMWVENIISKMAYSEAWNSYAGHR
jgi:hypothetical protein